MSLYHIEHRITTVAELYDRFEFRGFTLAPWKYDPVSGTCGDAWCVIKAIEAENVDEAFLTFRRELLSIVDRIAFVSQCYTVAEQDPYLVIRINDNERRQLFFRYSEERPVTPLMFMDEEKNALEALEAYKDKGDVFRYLREATNATTFYTRWMMLISALEAMAGERVDLKGRRKQTKTTYIENEILKAKDLYEKLYGYGTGLRHKLMHGGKVDLTSDEHKDRNYVAEIYEAILRYFRESHGAVISTEVVGPQRTRLGNYRSWAGWIEPRKSDVPLDLLSLHEAFKNTNDGGVEGSDANFIKLFVTLDGVPEGY